MVWAWERYKPSAAVLDNIWHVRQAPATITPTAPSTCPIANARTRILERRQTDSGVGRNVYQVAIDGGDSPDSLDGGIEVRHVDASRILDFVSARELERFENEQFRVEAEAQAVADRAQVEEQVHRRMAKNMRMAAAASGLPVLDALGIDPDLQTASLPGRPRGRGRGRPRGRPRGSGRGVWRGRGGLVENSALPLELLPDMRHTSDDGLQSPRAEEDAHRSKRRRTQSVTPQHRTAPHHTPDITPQHSTATTPHHNQTITPHQTLMFPPSSQLDPSISSSSSTPDYTTPPPPPHPHSMLQPTTLAPSPTSSSSAEEYVVEAIIEHYHDDEGRKLYLVKWAGYEDSHDWLLEGDLGGAAQMVREYDERVGRREGMGTG